MKRYSTVLGAVLFVAVLALSGCQQQQGPAIPSDPIQAVQLIADKQKEITSQHLDLNADLTLMASGLPEDDPTAVFLSDFKASLTAAGDVDAAKEDFQLSGTADLGVLTSFLAPGGDELTFDLVKVGDTMYARLGEEDWSESPVEAATGGAEPNLDILSDLLKKVAQAERLGDEAIDGVDSYHFKVTLDPVELISELAKLGGGAADISESDLAQATELLKDSQVDVDLWVGKADLFIRQQRIHLKLDLKNIPDMPPDAAILAELNVTMKASNINQPVAISAPQ